MRRPRPDIPRSAKAPPRSEASGLPPAVLAFLEHLRRLPMGAWADAARAAGPSAPLGIDGALHAAGRARLRHVVDSSPTLTARIRSRVHDTVAVLHGFLHPVDVLRMKKAALGAALAIAARPALDPEDFDRLYAPFSALIPLRDLASAAKAGDLGASSAGQLPEQNGR